MYCPPVNGVCYKAIVAIKQCDQIGQFIGLWATFQSLWQQFNLPESPTFLGNLCKGEKIFYFSSEIIFGQLL